MTSLLSMTPRQLTAFLCIFLAYIAFGGLVFYEIEHRWETEQRAESLKGRIKINEMLVRYTSFEDEKTQNEVLAEVSDYCGKPVTNYTLDEYPDDYLWTPYHAFYFALTTCSTVGYGNISPHETLGQIIVIFYSLIGLPVHTFLLAYMSNAFSNTFVRLYKRYKDYKSATTKNYIPPKFGLIAKITLYITTGVVLFIFLPAFVFQYFEGWGYVASVYFAYITLTTIGYGDYVPSFQNGQARQFGIAFKFYEAFIIVWNTIGLGYFLMIIGFIMKFLQGKRMAQLEHQLSQQIKASQNRIRAGVTHDVNFLRRILNEVHLMKFKPIYMDSIEPSTFHSLPRHSSCPDLTKFTEQRTDTSRYSENAQPPESPTISTGTLNRVQSDSDLNRIDKAKTFEGAENVYQTGDLLSRVVTALGSIRPTDEDGQSCLELGMDGGVHGFSDSKILASERRSSGWSLAQLDGIKNNPSIRRRTASSVPQQSSHKNYSNNHSVALTIPDTLEVPTGSVNRSFISKINPFKSRVSGEDGKRDSVTSQDMNPQLYLENTSRGRDSQISLPRQYLSATAKGRNSVFAVLEQPLSTANLELLEKTTIADLMRALEVVHMKADMSPGTPLFSDYTVNPRKPIEKVRTGSPPNVPNLQVPTNRSRRGSRRDSLRPIPGYTTIFASQNINNPLKKSVLLDPESATLSRRRSISPPSYAILQQKPSLRPSPLATNDTSQSSGRYSLQSSQQSATNDPSQANARYSRQSSQQSMTQPPIAATRSLLWRPAQLQLSEQIENGDKNRSDSK